MISDDDPHLDEAMCEAHPEVVLAVVGHGVDQPSARAAADPCLDPHYHSRGAESENLLKHQCTPANTRSKYTSKVLKPNILNNA